MKLVYFLTLLLIATPLKADWKITQESLEIKDKITYTEEATLYTGDTIIHNNEIEPKEGYKYVLASIRVSNKDTTVPSFNSKDFFIKTKNNTYNRILNDTFLLDYALKPFTKLKIKRGYHQGVLLFEIKNEDLNENLILEHKLYQVEKK